MSSSARSFQKSRPSAVGRIAGEVQQSAFGELLQLWTEEIEGIACCRFKLARTPAAHGAQPHHEDFAQTVFPGDPVHLRGLSVEPSVEIGNLGPAVHTVEGSCGGAESQIGFSVPDRLIVTALARRGGIVGNLVAGIAHGIELFEHAPLLRGDLVGGDGETGLSGEGRSLLKGQRVGGKMIRSQFRDRLKIRLELFGRLPR